MLNKDLNDKRDKLEHDISGAGAALVMVVIAFVVLWILGGAV